MLVIFIALQLNPVNYLHFFVFELCILPSPHSFLDLIVLSCTLHCPSLHLSRILWGHRRAKPLLGTSGTWGWEMGFNWNIPACSGSRLKGEFCFWGGFLGSASLLETDPELTWQDLPWLYGEHKCSSLVFAASFNSFPIQYQPPLHLLWIGRLKRWCFPALVWEVISSEWH